MKKVEQESSTIQDASKYTSEQHVTNLVSLVRRLVRLVDRLDPNSTLAKQASGYLERSGFRGSILRESSNDDH